MRSLIKISKSLARLLRTKERRQITNIMNETRDITIDLTDTKTTIWLGYEQHKHDN